MVKSKVNAYRLENQETIKPKKKSYYRRSIAKRLLYEAKRRAAQKSLPFNLTVEDFTIPATCPVLGIPVFVSNTYGPEANSPSLDRIIPALGYVKGNICVISWRANRLKSDATIDEMEAIIKYMRAG